MNYVIGFAFCGNEVALIRKTKPAWQAGRLNGIGGKVENGEGFPASMVREFQEETGILTERHEWSHKITMLGSDWQAEVFAMEMEHTRFDRLKTTTEEQVFRINLLAIQGMYENEELIEHIPWMLSLCRDTSGVRFPVEFRMNPRDGQGSPRK